MKFFTTIRTGVCAILCAVSASAIAQENCATSLERAAKSYDIGNLEEVIAILTPCVNGMSNTDAWQSYRLLALSYLFRDDEARAEDAINHMLRLNPGYERNPERDPLEFLEVLNRYTWYPQVSLSVVFGGIVASPYLLRSYSLDPFSPAAAVYSGTIGTSFEGGVEYHLTSALALGIGAKYLNSVFSRTASSAYKFSSSYTEHLSYFTIPLSAKYEFHIGWTVPFITAGAFLQLAPNANGAITGIEGLDSASAGESLHDVDATDRRTSVIAGVMVGTGVAYPLGGGHITVAARYWMGLGGNVNGAKRYSNASLLYPYSYIDDDFSMRNLEISLGFLYHLNFRAQKN